MNDSIKEKKQTYLGSIDDSVARYPNLKQLGYKLGQKNAIKSDALLKQFDQDLHFSIFFGSDILINDGYLLNHPAAQLALLKPNKSSLYPLLASGNATILKRKQDTLASVAEMMNEQENSSFQELVGDTKSWRDFQQALRTLEGNKSLKTRDWPPYNLGQGLVSLLEEFIDDEQNFYGFDCITQEDKKRLWNEVKQSGYPHLGTRGKWENSVKKHFGGIPGEDEDLAKTLAFMNIANTLYHINFTMCLQKDFGSESEISVDTQYLPGIENFLPNSLIENRHIDEIDRTLKECGESFNFLFNMGRLTGEQVTKIYDNNIKDKKDNFLKCLDTLHLNESDGEKKFRDAASTYANELQEIIKPQTRLDIIFNKLSLETDKTKGFWLNTFGRGYAYYQSDSDAPTSVESVDLKRLYALRVPINKEKIESHKAGKYKISDNDK